MNNLNFKKFYNDQNDYKKTEEFLIREMSLRTDDNLDVLNISDGIITQGLNGVKLGKYIEDFVDSNHNLYQVYYFNNDYIFVNSQKLAMAIISFSETNDYTIKMNFVNVFHKCKNLSQDIFVNYLLKKYSTIISDNVHTVGGFYFYKKMCSEKEKYGYKFFINGPDGKKEISDCIEMNSTFGYDEKHLGYTYIISKL